MRCGYVHTTVHELERDGRKLLKTVTELKLTVQRFQDTVTLRMETGTEETPDGAVTGVSMKQFLGKQQTLSSTGTVEDGKLHVYSIDMLSASRAVLDPEGRLAGVIGLDIGMHSIARKIIHTSEEI